ncbi:hypothetical protein ACGFK1_18345 [Mycobacterium sp. NPDC048908]|uniref:hypothetical protein n=1 Tax=Mycobacterium sp. NPDC048908 TaxID=3364292 RepID=UPI0037121EC4
MHAPEHPELLAANPMPHTGRPKVPKFLPKSHSTEAVARLAAATDDEGSARRNERAERDRAIVFTSLLAGLRAHELINANIGDIRLDTVGVSCRCSARAIRTAESPSAQSFSL